MERSVFGRETVDQILQRRQLFAFNQIELMDKEDKMLEAGVQVLDRFQMLDCLEVFVVDVSVHPEQPLHYRLRHLWKIARKWFSNVRREDVFVIELVLNPSHQVVNI